jgi:hypothetical protein
MIICSNETKCNTYNDMFPVGSEKDGCSALFAHTQFFYSIIIAVFMVSKFLVPTWTVLCVFQPVEGDTRNSEVALAVRYNLVRCFTTNMGLFVHVFPFVTCQKGRGYLGRYASWHDALAVCG